MKDLGKNEKNRGRGRQKQAGKNILQKIESSNLKPPKRSYSNSRKDLPRKSNSSPTLNHIYQNTKFGRHSSENRPPSAFNDSIEALECEKFGRSRTTSNVFCGITPTDQNLIFSVSKTSVEDPFPPHYLTYGTEKELGEFSRSIGSRTSPDLSEFDFSEQFQTHVFQLLGKYFDVKLVHTDDSKKCANFYDVDSKNDTHFATAIHNSKFVSHDDSLQENLNSLNLNEDEDFADALNQLNSIKDTLLNVLKNNGKLQKQLRHPFQVKKTYVDDSETSLKSNLKCFVRYVKKIEDKLADERQRTEELKAVIGCHSSHCLFHDNFTRFCYTASPLTANHKSKRENYDVQTKGNDLTSTTENEELERLPCFLQEFENYVHEISPEIRDDFLSLKCQQRSNEEAEIDQRTNPFKNDFQTAQQRQIKIGNFKLEDELNELQINLSNEFEKQKENDFKTEEIRVVEKILALILAGVNFNQRKTTRAKNSEILQEGKPIRVNIFNKLLSKIKGKQKIQNSRRSELRSSEDAGAKDWSKAKNSKSLNFLQKMEEIESKLKKILNNKQESPKSSRDQKRKQGASFYKPGRSIQNIMPHNFLKKHSLFGSESVLKTRFLVDTGEVTGKPQMEKYDFLNNTWKRHVENAKKLLNQNHKLVKESQSLLEANEKLFLEGHAKGLHAERLRDTNQKLETEVRNLNRKFEILGKRERELLKQLEDVKFKLHDKNGNGKPEFLLQLGAWHQYLDVLKESLNSQDMSKVKEKLSPFFPDLEWNMEDPPNSLSHLLKIYRSCVNHVTECLTRELTTKQKETEICREGNAKLTRLSEESANNRKLLQTRAVEINEGKKFEETLSNEEVKRLKEEIMRKDVQIESLKFETHILQESIDALNHVILTSGTGDSFRGLDQHIPSFDENTNKTKETEELRQKNLEMMEQLATQQSTLLALQNERVRHLEEKNFLNTKLQAEFGRIEQLEENFLTMKKEANRLAIVAEYNKQLAEILQHEVSEREAVIIELQNNMKALNDVQKEKTALCQELTELCNAKDVLNSKLDEQIKKNAHLTEVQRMAELKALKDLEAAKEMQHKEQGVVKEVMADFEGLVRRREELSKKQAKTTLKVESLRTKNTKLHDKISKANKFIYEKISVIMQLEDEVSEKEKLIQKLSLDLQDESAKHDKEIKRLKTENKLVSKENKALQDSAESLRVTIKKLQDDLNEAWTSRTESGDLLQLKIKELGRLESLYNDQNFELLRIRDERNQLESQIDGLVQQRKNVEKERDALEEQIKNLESTTEEEIEDLKQELRAKAEKLAVLEVNYESTEKLHDRLRKDFEDIAIENRGLKNIKLELMAERDNLILNNDSLKEEVQILSNKLELIEEYGKIGDLDESIKAMLQSSEKTIREDSVDKSCYIRLEEAHKDLAQKLLRTAHLLIDEKLGRQETENKLDDCKHRLSEVEAEKLDEVRRADAAFEELEMCKRKFGEMLHESKKVSLVIQAKYEEFEVQLNEYKEKYESMKDKYNSLISDNNHHKDELIQAKERIEELKVELDCRHTVVFNLQEEISRLQQDLASAEFERGQKNMQLHEATKELELQREYSQNLELMNRRALTVISEMKDKGILQTSECETLFFVIRGSNE